MAGYGFGDDDIMPLIVQREQARMVKDFASADSLRDQLGAAGVTLHDKTQTWKASDGRTGRIPTFQEIEQGEIGQAPAGFVQPPGDSDVAHIKHLVKLREAARAEKDWAQSDRIREDLRALGVELQDKDKVWKSQGGQMGIIVGYRGDAGPSDHEIEVLVAFREKARQNNDYKTSDMVRDELRACGIDLNDKLKVWRSAEGRQGPIPTWQNFQPAVPMAPVAALRPPAGFAAPDIRQQVVQAALQAASNPITAARTLQLLQTAGGAPSMPPPRPVAVPRPAGAAMRSPEAAEAAALARRIQAQKRPPMEAEVDALVTLREKARKAKDFAGSDELRGLLRGVGIELQDQEKRWTTTDGRSGAIPLWSALP